MAGQYRIAVGGFQHETNTFAPVKARFQDFEQPDGWPGLQRGAGMFATFRGMNLPIAGAIAYFGAAGHTVLPTVWASAPPSAEVEEHAYERIVADLLDDLAMVLPVDGVYLCLHGAMVAEHLEDGEGVLLERVRRLVGPGVPIVASLDLHANVTPEMVEFSDALIAYQTYPHVDMASTGERAARLLERLIAGEPRWTKAYRQLPFLIPLSWQCTLTEPAQSIYADLDRMLSPDIASLSFAPGFPAADIRHCGPAVMGYGTDRAAVEAAVERLAERILDVEGEFAGKIWQPDEAVRHAIDRSRGADRPIVIADTQDNPGAGGTSDTVGLLAALLRHNASGAVLGLMVDPEAADRAHEAGEGAFLDLALGGKSGAPGQAPLAARFQVRRLGDGNILATGPMWGGSHMQLGRMALLEVEGVRIIVASRKMQAADQALFRHLGIEPADVPILVLKSSVHFRADFQPIAAEILVAAAPGAMIADPADLPFERLRPGVRLRPLGPVS